MPLPQWRPRAAYDRGTLRRGLSAGGAPFAGRASGIRPPLEYTGYPPTQFDGLIDRKRGLWYHTGNYVPLADPQRATDAGPLRPDTHQHTWTYRRWQGGSHQSREGWHSTVPLVPQRSAQAQRRSPVRQVLQRFVGQSSPQSVIVPRG